MRRLLEGREISFNNGNHIGILPYGYVRNEYKNIVFDKYKIEIVFEIFKLRYDGFGYKLIAKKLNLYNENNEPRLSFVRTILSNIFYAGYIKFGKNIVNGNHQGIIDINDFLRINNVSTIKEYMDKNAR